MRYSIPRKSRRVPLVTEVHLKLEELPDPVTAVTTNVSLGGMSVAIQRPAEIGSLAAFELEVGGALVEGTGEVAWIRGAADGIDQPSGMGIRFRYLSPGSRERIFRLVQWYANQGGGASGEAVAAASTELSPPPGGLKAPVPKRESALEATQAGIPAPEFPPPAPPPPTPPPMARVMPSGRVIPAEPEPLVPEDLLAELPLAGEPAGFEIAEPEPPLVVPAAAEEPRISPAEVAQAAPARPRSNSSSRGAGYARPRRLGFWGILALLILLGSALLAAVAWWPVVLRVLGKENGKPAATFETRSDLPREAEASVPSRRDATRMASVPSTPQPVAAEPPAQANPTEPSSAEPAATEPAPPEPTPVAAGPARQVRRISWESAEGATTLVVETDGVLKSSSASASLLSGDSPRVVLKIKGIDRKYPEARLEVGTPQVATIRTALHDLPAGPELHVVLDLRARNLELDATRISGNELRLTVRARR